ncbi:MAG: hypothetical protein N4A49_04465 [Marinifilaceae bacterium]|jgi:hypothetical protein|nr:hypothetical protein [Marinifilaceae bacterium]
MRKFLIILIGFLVCHTAITSIAAYSATQKLAYYISPNSFKENVNIITHGKVKFNKQYTDVIGMSDNAFVKIYMVSFGIRRRITIEKIDGKISRRYFIGKKEADFEPSGREMLANVLPDLIRDSNLDMNNRVNSTYEERGLNGFIDKISSVESDYIKALMVKNLLKDQQLSNDELVLLIRDFPYRIKSDFELSQILKHHNSKFLRTDVLSKEFFRSFSEISSDFEKSQVLKAVYKKNELNDIQFDLYLQTIASLRSDFEKSTLIKFTLKFKKINKTRHDLLLKLVDNISSDYERSQIMEIAIKTEDFANLNVEKLISMAESLNSDFESGKILGVLIENNILTSEHFDSFSNILSEFSSSYEYKNTLVKLMEYDKLGPEKFDFLLGAADDINSDYELAGYLAELHSKTKNISVDQELKILEKSKIIDSDYSLSKFLIKFMSKTDMTNTKIRKSIIACCQKIDSEYEYGKVMKAIFSYPEKKN